MFCGGDVAAIAEKSDNFYPHTVKMGHRFPVTSLVADDVLIGLKIVELDVRQLDGPSPHHFAGLFCHRRGRFSLGSGLQTDRPAS